MNEMSQEELKENFDHFDSDGDGQLEFSEFVCLIQALDADAPDDEARLGFRAIDTDGSGVIEFEEFAQWFSSR